MWTSRISASSFGEQLWHCLFGRVVTVGALSVDFNVPLDGQTITNNAVRRGASVLCRSLSNSRTLQRIVGALPTIQHALEHGRLLSFSALSPRN